MAYRMSDVVVTENFKGRKKFQSTASAVVFGEGIHNEIKSRKGQNAIEKYVHSEYSCRIQCLQFVVIHCSI